VGRGAGPSTESPARATRLAGASSVYLRSAAEQSIDWYPWGPEAFAEASRSRRPILLDVGAAWCHWCHVMDEGTYADAEVARLIGQHFVAVKVDRDELPEVDRRYQRQVNALTGEGGWPLTAFLTAEGEVFLGGTYFPPQDAVGRPGFRRVLREVARLWKDEPERLRENVAAVRQALARAAPPASASGTREHLVGSIRRDIAASFDPVHGGFGHAPKFPHPTGISFLLLDAFRTQDPDPAERARLTLERMADGGMYDQLGGGFHRYSVDEGWHIPHFEKMGVDNAALLALYVEGARRFGHPRFAEVVRESTAWAREVLMDPAGGFGASQDADNAPGDDGSYFTWSRSELKAALEPKEFRLLSRYYGIGTDGRMPHDPERNVLFRLLPLTDAAEGMELSPEAAAALLAGAQAKLRTLRAERPTPLIDRALYANINGGFVRGFAQAGQFLGVNGLVLDARRAADRFLAEAYRPGEGVAHRLAPEGAAGFGQLDDQAEFAYGLVELGAVTAEPRYLRAAQDILDTIFREFPGEGGLLRDLAPRLYDGPSVGALGEPSYPLEDSPHLSANAATALAALRLAALTNDERARERLGPLLDALAARLGSAGLFAAGSGLAAGLLEVPAGRIVVEGEGPRADALFEAAVHVWHPLAFAFRGTPPPPISLPEEFAVRPEPGAAPRALVCFGMRCLAPISEPEQIGPALLRPS
jgi:uncharacterized protein YyaL (SSP411 family)